MESDHIDIDIDRTSLQILANPLPSQIQRVPSEYMYMCKSMRACVNPHFRYYGKQFSSPLPSPLLSHSTLPSQFGLLKTCKMVLFIHSFIQESLHTIQTFKQNNRTIIAMHEKREHSALLENENTEYKIENIKLKLKRPQNHCTFNQALN